jgi:hypothetical protein
MAEDSMPPEAARMTDPGTELILCVAGGPDKFDDAVTRSITEVTRISEHHATEIEALIRRLNPSD